jgi:hypothetical protein
LGKPLGNVLTHSQYAGKEQYQYQYAHITPGPAPYKCSKTSGKVCRFPFRLNEKMHWDCVERDGTPVCNTKDSGYLQSFNNTLTFQPCTGCADCPQEGSYYGGFYLYNTAGNDDYFGVTSTEECQALCRLVTGCNFFTFFASDSAYNRCHLYYGVGEKFFYSPPTNSEFGRPFYGSKQCKLD